MTDSTTIKQSHGTEIDSAFSNEGVADQTSKNFLNTISVMLDKHHNGLC